MRSKETRNIQLARLGMIAAHFQGEWTETGIPWLLWAPPTYMWFYSVSYLDEFQATENPSTYGGKID